MTSRAMIFANGSLPDLPGAARLLRPGDFLIAADGGTRHLLALGCLPHAVIGDLDSLTEEEQRRLKGEAVEIRRHPADKDETDLELALRYAVEAGCNEIRVVGGLGGRLDQSLASLALLTNPDLTGLDIRLDDGLEQAFFLRTPAGDSEASCLLRGHPGDLISLLPWGQPAVGVSTQGLRWPLRGETLLPHATRGISNQLLGETATISLQSGLLLVIHSRRKD